MKIILGKQIVEIKKKDSENEKILLKNRNSEDINELDDDDVFFHSNAVKNIKLGSNIVNRIYLNNSIVYELEDTIDLNLFHSLVPKTATEIRFLYASNNPDLTDYQRIGYCDNNNFIEVWNNGTKYILINPRKNYIYAPVSCYQFLRSYTELTNCVFDNFDTRNVTSMKYMFYECKSLTSLDLSTFKTDNVTDMHSVFYECRGLTSLDISSFNTQNVTNMQDLFYGCSNLTSFDLSSFNTQNVITMQGMFSKCYNLKILDLSSFNTQKVRSMYAMFSNCSRLNTIIANTFNTTSLTISTDMFVNCVSLVGGNGTAQNFLHVNAEYARVDGENSLPGYFTAPANNNK